MDWPELDRVEDWCDRFVTLAWYAVGAAALLLLFLLCEGKLAL